MGWWKCCSNHLLIKFIAAQLFGSSGKFFFGFAADNGEVVFDGVAARPTRGEVEEFGRSNSARYYLGCCALK